MEIEVVAYTPQWEGMYGVEAALLEKLLSGVFCRCFHIGSTAVPNLVAKPVIDILLVVETLAVLDEHETVFTDLGYMVMGENGIAGRRFYVKGTAPRTHHLHAFQVDNVREIGRHVAFRDYLRAHPVACNEYGEMKLRLAQQFSNDRQGYVSGKNEYVKELEQKAMEWQKTKQAGT